jgi:hypothetical protein
LCNIQRTNTPRSLRTKLGLKHRRSRVDGAHTDARDDSADDHVRTRVGGGLQNSPNDHDDDAEADAPDAAEALAKDGGDYGADEATDCDVRDVVLTLGFSHN